MNQFSILFYIVKSPFGKEHSKVAKAINVSVLYLLYVTLVLLQINNKERRICLPDGQELSLSQLVLFLPFIVAGDKNSHGKFM